MKIIRVDTLDNLKEDVANYLGIEYSELLKVLERYMSNSDTDKRADKNEKKCCRYISRHKKYTLEEFYLCHVAAKLDCDEHTELLPLDKLLTTQNSFSDFLLEHGIKFEKNQNSKRKFDLFYKGKLIKYGNSRIKDRLSEDLCVNGFQFLEGIKSAQSYNQYCFAPEFLQDLDSLLGINLFGDFRKQSHTYVALCRVPKDRVVFDTNIRVRNFERRYIYFAMKYIWKYQEECQKCGSGDNPVLRALDTDTVIVEKWIPEKEIECQC